MTVERYSRSCRQGLYPLLRAAEICDDTNRIVTAGFNSSLQLDHPTDNLSFQKGEPSQ